MASDDVGSRPSRFMIIPNTKRHPNNTKTEQLPISEAITGLPRPYHNTTTKLVELSINNLIVFLIPTLHITNGTQHKRAKCASLTYHIASKVELEPPICYMHS